MKVDELRKIIYEEVQKAIRVELRDMLSEMQVKPVAKPQHNYATHKAVREPVTEQPFSLSSVLQETLEGMTRDDYRNIMGEPVVQVSEPSMLSESSDDMSGLPSFIRNAKAILDASMVKDMERNQNGI